ncbi:hypothetical protein ASE35_15280 [Lysobacter sp. Root916]|uniref:hypothetical protein n=1 Tax=Lysobacter sp. Root916 TaxID=1736606 RepID=UPI0007088E52|nr:hypothetical protein [Lysobacter sp. Root916]KRD31368.1 hypothetical protein ASE35_15280 [Lysobacter sp. Root916]
MKRLVALVAPVIGLYAFAACSPALANDDAQHGFTEEQTRLAASLPVYVIPQHPRLRPQMFITSVSGPHASSMGHIGNFTITGFPPAEAASLSALVGAGAGAQVLSAAVIMEQGRGRAQRNFDAVQQARCDLPVDDLQRAVVDSIRRSSWGATTNAKTDFFVDGSLDRKRLPPKDEPRLVFVVGAGFSVDFAHLMTTVDVLAYAPEGSGSAWKRESRWLYSFVAVSDPIQLDAKTTADIDAMTRAEYSRYALTGNEALVRKVNNAGFYAEKTERRKATVAATMHKQNLKVSAETEWSPDARGLRSSQLWAENDCARTRDALVRNTEEISRMLGALYAQKLPLEKAPAEATQAATSSGQRYIYALPGGLYVSRNEKLAVDLANRHYLMPD